MPVDEIRMPVEEIRMPVEEMPTPVAEIPAVTQGPDRPVRMPATKVARRRPPPDPRVRPKARRRAMPADPLMPDRAASQVEPLLRLLTRCNNLASERCTTAAMVTIEKMPGGGRP